MEIQLGLDELGRLLISDKPWLFSSWKRMQLKDKD